MPRAEKRQRKKEQRRAKVEEELRQYRLQRRRRLSLLILGLLLLVGVVATPLLLKNKPAKKTSPVASSCPTKAPEMSIDPTKSYQATVETSMGTIVIDLDAKQAPKTVNSFVALTRCHFYDGLTIHRIVKDFAIQGGDPKGDGTGGPPYKVVEAPPAGIQYTKGIVAMAKGSGEAAGTSGSQFFIVPSDTAAPQFTPDYALLGKVSTGLDVLDKLQGIELKPSAGDQGRPTTPVNPPKIVRITVVEPVTPTATPGS